MGDLDPVCELPYGPAASGAASEAGQMAASDHVLKPSRNRLRLTGRPQMESGWSAFGPLGQESGHFPGSYPVLQGARSPQHRCSQEVHHRYCWRSPERPCRNLSIKDQTAHTRNRGRAPRPCRWMPGALGCWEFPRVTRSMNSSRFKGTDTKKSLENSL